MGNVKKTTYIFFMCQKKTKKKNGINLKIFTQKLRPSTRA